MSYSYPIIVLQRISDILCGFDYMQRVVVNVNLFDIERFSGVLIFLLLSLWCRVQDCSGL